MLANGSCSGGDPSAKRETVEVVASEEGWAITVGARLVYWATEDAIRAAPLAGGEARTLYESPTLRGIVASGDDLFYSEEHALGRIRSGDPATREALVQVGPSDFCVADGYLYWSEQSPGDVVVTGERQGSISRVTLAGGEPELVTSGLEFPTSLAATSEAVFFGIGLNSGGIHRFSLRTREAQWIAPGSLAHFAADREGVYLVPADSRPAELLFAPNEGEVSTLIDELLSPARLAVDDSGVYVLFDSGRLSRTSHRGGELVTLATDLSFGSLALTEDAVYVTAPELGQVLRIDKAGTTPADWLSGNCPEPLADPAELASTPRPEPDVELLALRLDGSFVASDATYERLAADVARIRSELPEIDVTYRSPHDGKTLVLSLTEPAALSIESDEYGFWDCLNDRYGVEAVQLDYSRLTDTWQGFVTLEGVYDLERVAELYAMLPGVKSTGPGSTHDDGPTTCVTRNGDLYEYVVDDRGGDCPAGCTETTAYRFRSRGAGDVEALEVWSSRDGARPTWHLICDGF